MFVCLCSGMSRRYNIDLELLEENAFFLFLKSIFAYFKARQLTVFFLGKKLFFDM